MPELVARRQARDAAPDAVALILRRAAADEVGEARVGRDEVADAVDQEEAEGDVDADEVHPDRQGERDLHPAHDNSNRRQRECGGTKAKLRRRERRTSSTWSRPRSG